MFERDRQRRTDRPEGREFTTDEALEIESDRRRRVVAAFLVGGEAGPDRPALRPWRGVLGGIGLTAAAVIVVGVVAVASATLAAGGSSAGSPAPAHAVPSMTPTPHTGSGPNLPTPARP
jgi:hypothetical protein